MPGKKLKSKKGSKKAGGKKKKKGRFVLTE